MGRSFNRPSNHHVKIDAHHVWHNRRDYLTKPEKALRENYLFIPRMPYERHHAGYAEGLHQNVLPPPKPTPQMILGALVVAQEFRPNMQHIEAIERIAGYFENLRNGQGDLGEAIAENLFSQLTYINGQRSYEQSNIY